MAAFRNSWSLARGNRWSLFGLGLIVMVLFTVGYGALIVVALAASPWPLLIGYTAVLTVFGIFSMATTARAYVQLAADEGTTETAAAA